LHAFAASFSGGRQRRRVHRVIVYGGETRQDRSDVTVLPWSEVPAFDWVGARRT
jgi:hypothetical protein